MAVTRFRNVALHLLAAQQRVDARRLVEGLVAQEAQVGREFQVDPLRHLGAQALRLRFSAATTGSSSRPPSGMT